MRKNLLLIILSIILTFALCSCGRSIPEMEREAKKEAAFNDGYEAGYDEGYREGLSDAQERLKNLLHDLSWDTKNENGVDAETAIQILTNYADGEPITEAQLNQAIWAIKQYYWESYWAIGDIDNYYE